MSRASDATPSYPFFADYGAARRFMRPKLAAYIKIVTRCPVPKALAQGTLDNLWFELYSLTFSNEEKDTGHMISLLEAGALTFVIESIVGMRKSPELFRPTAPAEHLKETVCSLILSNQVSVVHVSDNNSNRI